MSKKTEDINKKKNIFKILLVIIVILIFVMFIIKYKKSNSKLDNEKTENNISNSQEENLYMEGNVGGINIENLDNAKLVDGEKENTSDLLLKEKEFEGLKITEINLKSNNGLSNFTAKVINESGKDFKSKILLLKFVNKDGSEYASLEIYIPDLSNGKETTIDASITEDIINAYDFKITNVK